jgi:hypothetical protein
MIQQGCRRVSPHRQPIVGRGCRLLSPSEGRRLSGDAPWVAFTPAGDGLIERGVVPQFAEEPVGLLTPLC